MVSSSSSRKPGSGASGAPPPPLGPEGRDAESLRVFLVEDSIVRSTTMKVLLKRIREQGQAREIHVRVACPPIVSPSQAGSK